MCRKRECQVLTHTTENFKKVVVFKVLECLCMRVLAGVLLLSSLMGKNEIKITVTHPEILGHTVTWITSCLGKTVTHLTIPYQNAHSHLLGKINKSYTFSCFRMVYNGQSFFVFFLLKKTLLRFKRKNHSLS